MADYVVFRDGEPLALTDKPEAWLLRHQPVSPEWALKHEGYSYKHRDEIEEPVYQCHGCGKPIIGSGGVARVLVPAKPEPVSVPVHDVSEGNWCRRHASARKG